MDLFLKRLVKTAGERARARFGKETSRRHKSKNPSDIVTNADVAIEHFIVREILKRYPGHGIIGEESGVASRDAEYVWIIDPIDGTINFGSGVPIYGTMLALMSRGVIIAAGVYLPQTAELFFARAGRGAWKNGTRISASRCNSLEGSRGCISSTINKKTMRFYERLFQFTRGKHAHIAAFGSLAFGACTVARGARDWYISSSPHIHDNGPISLILSEAGYTVTDVYGKPIAPGSSGLVAARPKLHRDLLRITRGTL